MQQPFDVESPYREQLADLVTRVVAVDARIRALQAERVTLFAEAHQLAEQEGRRPIAPLPGSWEYELAAAEAVVAGTRPEPSKDSWSVRGSGLPRGGVARRDRAHRVIRAELAAALHVSEWTIGNDLGHAIDTIEHCPALHAAHAAGLVTEQHVRGVVDAGRIISHQVTELQGSTLVDADGVLLDEAAAQQEIARRYVLFDQAMVPHAVALTAKQLVPVAKRLAEKLAGVSFDDRHRVAKRDRRVWVTDLEDGMCHLTAYVTSFEGHAIFDRLTQYGKQAQARDAANTSAGGLSRGSSVAGDAAAAALKRPLPEARADSLVTLLLEGETPPEVADIDGMGGGAKRLGPRVTARVQVLVPVSLTGRLDSATPPTVPAQDGWFQPELVGVGPLDTDTATRIAHDTPTWDTITITDGTGSDMADGGGDDGDSGRGTSTSTSTCTCPGSGSGSGTGGDGVDANTGAGPDTVGDILTVDGYRVPAHIRRHLAARDLHCRFLGCTLPVYRCDIDHTIAFEDGGPTATTNLAYTCRGHHVMKHHGGCHVTQGARGGLTWTLPSGRIYHSKPPSKVMFSTALGPPDFPTLMAESQRRHPYGPGFTNTHTANPMSDAANDPVSNPVSDPGRDTVSDAISDAVGGSVGDAASDGS